ncbi:hypothetical protein DDW12_08195, partial [Sulfolobus islandicus]
MTIGLFISHGSPTILIDENKWKDLLRRVGKEIEEKYKPETIIVSSPHFVSWRIILATGAIPAAAVIYL